MLQGNHYYILMLIVFNVEQRSQCSIFDETKVGIHVKIRFPRQLISNLGFKNILLMKLESLLTKVCSIAS